MNLLKNFLRRFKKEDKPKRLSTLDKTIIKIQELTNENEVNKFKRLFINDESKSFIRSLNRLFSKIRVERLSNSSADTIEYIYKIYSIYPALEDAKKAFNIINYIISKMFKVNSMDMKDLEHLYTTIPLEPGDEEFTKKEWDNIKEFLSIPMYLIFRLYIESDLTLIEIIALKKNDYKQFKELNCYEELEFYVRTSKLKTFLFESYIKGRPITIASIKEEILTICKMFGYRYADSKILNLTNLNK